MLANGSSVSLGKTEAAPVISMRDYSRRETDDFGVTTVVKRGFSRRMSVKLGVPFAQIDGVRRQLDDLRATVVTWIGSGRFAWLSFPGIYKDLAIDIATPPLSSCTLTIEGVSETSTVADSGADPAVAGKRSTFHVLDPVEVADANLAASSVAESDAPRWDAGSTYAKDARVIRGRRVYVSLIASNTGRDPATSPGGWLDTGPTNRWAMFDQALGTATIASGEIVVRLAAGQPTAVALLDTVGATIRVEGAGYDRTKPVGDGTVTFLDLPAGVGEVTVRVTGPGAVKVGTLLIGRVLGLGRTEASPTAGITDYSRISVDDFGETTIVRRGSSKRMQAGVQIRTDAVDVVANRLAALRAVPALWIGREGMDTLTIYGFWKDWSLPIGDATSKLSIEIEGMAEAAKVAPFKTGVDWEDLGDPTGTKPTNNADKTSENTSKNTAAVGKRPAEEVNTALDRVEILPEAVALLKSTTVDLDASLRQAEAHTERLSQAALDALVQNDQVRQVLRDAGIVVDPVSGKVRIYAVDQTNEKLSRVEITLDAQASRIALSATLNQVREEIARAQLDPSGDTALGDLIARINEVEIAIDGLEAEIVLKASQTVVGTLGGKVTDVEQRLDAAEGQIALKASQTQVDGLSTRVGEAIQLFQSLGDVSSVTTTVRQARFEAESAATGSLENLLSKDELARRQARAAAEGRQEVYALIDDRGAAEASARLRLAAIMEDSQARIGQELATVAAEGRSLARALEIVEAQLGPVGTVTIYDMIQAVVEENGRILGERTMAVDINGNVVGQKLIGSESGPGALALINADLRMGTGRVIFNTGVVMMVMGLGFGAALDLVLWLGPSMPLERCTRANGVLYFATDGDVAFTGSLTVGPLTVPNTSSDLRRDAQVSVGPYGSDGRRVTLVASWRYDRTQALTFPATSQGLADFEAIAAQYGATGEINVRGSVTRVVPASTVVLTRSVGGPQQEIDRRSFDREQATFYGIRPVPGDSEGTAEITQAIGGGFTVIDPEQSVVDRIATVTLSRGIDYPQAGSSQRLTIISQEEQA